MEKISIIAVLAAAIFVAAIITAGCTQDTGSSSGSPANGQQYTTSGAGNTPPSGNAGSQSGGYAGNSGSPGGSQQSRMQGLLTNQTRLAAAAATLGVSESDLQNALNSTVNTTNGRPNLAAAAQQLGVTQQQLMAAFGFPAGGYRGNRSPAMATPASGQ